MRINQENKSLDIEARDINYILPAYVRSYLFYSKNEFPEKIIFPMFASVTLLAADRQSVVIPIEWVPPLDAIATEIAKDGSDVAEVTPAQEAALDEKDEEIDRLKAEIAGLKTTEEGEDVVGGTVSEDTTDEASDLQLEEDTTPVPAPDDLIRQQEEAAIPLEAIDEKETEEQTATRLEEQVGGKPEPPSKAKVAFNIGTNRIPKQPPGGDIGPGSGLSDMHARDHGDQQRTARDLKEEPDIKEEEEKPFEKEVSRDNSGKPVVGDKPNES